MTRTIVLVALGAGSFGALLGFWVALSASAVVITVLPLLFALASGAGGAVLWRLDPDKPVNQRKLEMFGAGAAAFSLLCLGSMLLAINQRTTIAGWLVAKPDVVSVTGYADPLGALIYRSKLAALGATNDEIKALLGKPFPAGWTTSADTLDKAVSEGQLTRMSNLQMKPPVANVLTSHLLTESPRAQTWFTPYFFPDQSSGGK